MLDISSKLMENGYIIGMSVFSIGCLFNLIAFIVVIASGLAKRSVGVYVLVLLITDTTWIFTTSTMTHFYNPMIDYDIFGELGGKGGVQLCLAFNFLSEATYYMRQVLICAILIDQFLLVIGKRDQATLYKGSIPGVIISMVICLALAGYWIYRAKALFPTEFSPQSKSCKLVAIINSSKWSEHWWMNFMVHIVLPDGLLTILIIILIIMAACAARSKAAENLEDEDRNIKNVMIGLAMTNICLRCPFIITNCIFLYLDKWHDFYNFPENHWDNIGYSAMITPRIKDFVCALNFFVLLFIVQFRDTFFCRKPTN